MKYIIQCCLLVLLSACQNTNTVKYSNVNNTLYLDTKFPNYQSINLESSQDVFAIDEDMKLMVKTKLIPERDTKKRALKLLKHIFSKDNIDLDYRSGANITAIDAYHSQQANCLSLTIMAYVLAKESGLNISFQDVEIPEYWVRNGKYNLLTGHVNLVITKAPVNNKLVVWGNELLQIDFDPYVIKKSFPRKKIDKTAVLAMFYNNKGAQALIDFDYTKAYAYFREATTIAPDFDVSWGNLGILYRLSGYTELSIKTYQYAIALDGKNLTAMSNLAIALTLQGETEEVLKIQKKLHGKRVKNPYYHALLADEAFYDGDTRTAIKHYKSAIKLDKSIHEFYFGLAKVYYKVNQLALAKKSMARAIKLNKGRHNEEQYIAKLNFLKKAELSY
ncbi:MAG: tetratricopeptide (TPR) repeat protein [Alteromonadaceae bacterium]|jgi:tetratricopeptide (TPR) repeat protein